MKKILYASLMLLVLAGTALLVSCNLKVNSPSGSGAGGSLPYNMWQCSDDDTALHLTTMSGTVTYQEAQKTGDGWVTIVVQGLYRVSGTNIQFKFTSCDTQGIDLSIFPTTAKLEYIDGKYYIVYNGNYFEGYGHQSGSWGLDDEW